VKGDWFILTDFLLKDIFDLVPVVFARDEQIIQVGQSQKPERQNKAEQKNHKPFFL